MNKKSLKLVSAMLFLSGLPSGYIQTALGTTVAGIQVIQQNGTCTGIVTDQNGETVIGASVVVKGTTNGTISGLDGDFSIPSVKKGDVIIITYVGYVSQEIVWDGKPMKVILKEDSKTLDEVVVVGYGTTSKRKTTSAVSQVKADDIAKVPVPNITQSLAGRAPGLIVTQSGGVLMPRHPSPSVVVEPLFMLSTISFVRNVTSRI